MRKRLRHVVCESMVAVLSCALFLATSVVCQAQTTGTVSSLFLSNGAELDFGLYGTNGGQSDRIDVTNQFNYSSSSPGTYIVGFSHNDKTALLPGTVFTLVTFGSTNFAATDANRFQAAPRGNTLSIDGTFLLNLPGIGGNPRGSLQFVLGSTTDLPEPTTLVLLGGVAFILQGYCVLSVRCSPRGGRRVRSHPLRNS